MTTIPRKYLWRLPELHICATTIRPPDIVVGGLMFYQGFFLLLFRPLVSELAERNSAKIGHMVGSKCSLKMHVQNLGYPFPLQRLRNLTANLTAYVFGMKHDVDNQLSALQTTRSLLYHFKTTWILVHKRLQIGPLFLPTLRKMYIPLHCQASQTEISKRNSTKLCQTVDGMSR